MCILCLIYFELVLIGGLKEGVYTTCPYLAQELSVKYVESLGCKIVSWQELFLELFLKLHTITMNGNPAILTFISVFTAQRVCA